MKIKNKGKVYPSPSSSSSSTRQQESDVLFVLKLLPTAVLTLASVLSLEDREVLAYMITRSMKPTTTTSTTTTTTTTIQESKKKSAKKPPHTTANNNNNYKAPIFDCDCFDCYTSYWFRWDSSPNRELIHQVIEAFEDHLANGEQPKRPTRAKRRDKVGGRRVGDKPVLDLLGRPEMAELGSPPAENDDSSSLASSPSPERADGGEEREEKGVESAEMVEAAEEMAVVVRSPAEVSNHKGLARKVLPDVLGLLNCRLWSLWGPNV